jgi:hypothetical protein
MMDILAGHSLQMIPDQIGAGKRCHYEKELDMHVLCDYEALSDLRFYQYFINEK